MITYSTNYMGPVNVRWWTERGLDVNKHPYYGGRIDVYGLSEDDYYNGRAELGLPIMSGEDYNRLSEWLDGFTTKSLLSYDEIMVEYEKDNPTIKPTPEPLS